MKPEDYDAAAVLVERSPKMPCSYCGKPMEYGHPELHPTKDHIWPKAVRSIDAGRTGKLWCCAKCNLEKGDMMPSEWLARLQYK